MKVTIQLDRQTCTVEEDELVTAAECVQLIRQAMVGVGFHPENVKDELGEG